MKDRILFLGPPGAGKGTQATILCDENNFLHLSTGDLLRKEVSSGTSLGQKAEKIMNKGELVGDDIVLELVKKNLTGKSCGWLLDGFPRNLNQAISLEPLLSDINQDIEAVLLIEIDDEILVSRLLDRGRDDDTEETIRNRLKVYRNQTAPLIDYYNDKDLLLSVNGDQEIKLVSQKIKEVLN